MRIKSILATALLSLLTASAPAAVTFTFQFNDVNTGFNDSGTGAARRAALIEAGNLVAGLFGNYTANIVLAVDGANTQPSTLAAAGSDFTLSSYANGFTRQGDVMLKILNGNGADPSPAAPDGTVTWNFNDHVWSLGNNVPNNEYDFISTAAHELLHAVGFSSEIGQNGRDVFNTAPGNPGKWAPFDRYVAGSAGAIINSTTFALDNTRWSQASVSQGGPTNALRFNGPNTLAANGGLPIYIYSPSTWEDGSSGSHLDDARYSGTYMMEAATNPGPGIRTFSPVEIAMLKDIGYLAIIPEPSSAMLLVSSVALLGFRRRR